MQKEDEIYSARRTPKKGKLKEGRGVGPWKKSKRKEYCLTAAARQVEDHVQQRHLRRLDAEHSAGSDGNDFVRSRSPADFSEPLL
jgi:hypothetical protein